MFFDAPTHLLLTDQRRRELLAEAEQYRLTKPARARPARPPDRVPRTAGKAAAECRWPVPR